MSRIVADLMPAIVQLDNQQLRNMRVVIADKPKAYLVYSVHENRPIVYRSGTYESFTRPVGKFDNYEINTESGDMILAHKVQGKCACGSPLRKASVSRDLRNITES